MFWTQTGYGLKPPPLLATDRTHEQNLDALKRHFKRTVPKYGPHVCLPHVHCLLRIDILKAIVNLAEQHGKEAAITQGYREYMTEMADKNAVYAIGCFSVFSAHRGLDIMSMISTWKPRG